MLEAYVETTERPKHVIKQREKEETWEEETMGPKIRSHQKRKYTNEETVGEEDAISEAVLLCG